MSDDVTRLLLDFSAGDPEAGRRVVPLVYAELKRIAYDRLLRERDDDFTPTALVHEVFLRLVDVTRVEWQDRAHFFALAARVMRRVLVDAARARRAQKRGGDAPHVPLDATEAQRQLGGLDRDDTLLALDEALVALGRRSERQARVVECRYFAGLTVEETAAVLDVSPRTVRYDWRLAQAWLYEAIRTDAT